MNFGRHLPDGRGGITDAVILNGAPLLNWKSYSLSIMSPTDISGKSAKAGNVPSPDPIVGWSKHKPEGPSFYRGHFTMDSPADTFLDVSGVQKGFVWVNGHNLGRAWNVGPTRTLYVPAPWLVKGDNEVIAFDIFPDSAYPRSERIRAIEIAPHRDEDAARRHRPDLHQARSHVGRPRHLVRAELRRPTDYAASAARPTRSSAVGKSRFAGASSYETCSSDRHPRLWSEPE